MSARPSDPQEPTRRPGKVLWICFICFVMIAAYAVVAVATGSEVVRIVAALVVGVAVFLPLRERVWGPDWREQLERSRRERGGRR